jgi:diguanylate cyclase (GGDEF)-like protein/PAS domain S-box-containing protein
VSPDNASVGNSAPHPAPDAPLRLLIVEDVPADAELEMYELRHAGVAATCRVVETAEDMAAAITAFRPDVILSDFALPHFDGLSALSLAQELAPATPFIFVSGTVGEEAAIRALRSGASDYVLKANLRRLPSAVERAVQDARSLAERRRTEAALAATRQRLQDVFASLPDVLWSASLPAQRIAFMSPACESVYGRRANEFETAADLFARVVHSADRDRVSVAWERALAGQVLDIECRIVRGDGTVRWINHRGHIVRDPKTGSERFDGLVRDITDAMHDRQRLARLAAIHGWLADINAAIVRIRQARDLMQEAVALVDRVGEVEGATATIFDADSSLVQFSVSSGTTPAPRSAGYESARQSAGNALIAKLTSDRRIWNDLATESGAPDRDELLARGIRSAAAFPLAIDGRTIGEIALYASQPMFFEPAVAGLLREVAGNLSLALHLISKQNEADYLALYDPLTGLPNRTLLQSRLRQFVAGARHGGGKLALILFNIERLRDVNMLGGQQAGDELLTIVANRLRAVAGDETRVARLAGDLFALIFTDLDDATALPGMIFGDGLGLQEVRHVVGDREIKVALRAGVGIYPTDGDDADALFRGAETALDEARVTRSRIAYCSAQIKAAMAHRLDVEHLISQALHQEWFVLHYQPKIDLATRRIRGVEALLRIADPAKGLIGPQEFIGVLEESRVIERVGRWAMEEALRAQARWRLRTGVCLPVAVNVSAVQLRSDRFVEQVADVLQRAGPDARLEIEITESVMIQDVDASLQVLRRLRALGVALALDDFGTGYSSLRYLSGMPLDTVKIDRSFITGLATSADDASIATAILSLAHSLNLEVVAEGVETEQQVDWLRANGCPVAQGYLLGRPMQEERFAEIWQADQKRIGPTMATSLPRGAQVALRTTRRKA